MSEQGDWPVETVAFWVLPKNNFSSISPFSNLT